MTDLPRPSLSVRPENVMIAMSWAKSMHGMEESTLRTGLFDIGSWPCVNSSRSLSHPLLVSPRLLYIRSDLGGR